MAGGIDRPRTQRGASIRSCSGRRRAGAALTVALLAPLLALVASTVGAPIAGATPPAVPEVRVFGAAGSFFGLTGLPTSASGHTIATTAVPGWSWAPGAMATFAEATPSGRVLIGTIPGTGRQDDPAQNTQSVGLFDPSGSTPSFVRHFVPTNKGSTCFTGVYPNPTPCPDGGPTDAAVGGADLSFLCAMTINGTNEVVGVSEHTTTQGPLTPAPREATPSLVGFIDSGAPLATDPLSQDAAVTRDSWGLQAENASVPSNLGPAPAFPPNAGGLPQAHMNGCTPLGNGDIAVSEYYDLPINNGVQWSSGRILVFGPQDGVSTHLVVKAFYQEPFIQDATSAVRLFPKGVESSARWNGASVSATDQRFYVSFDAFRTGMTQASNPVQELSWNHSTSTLSVLSRPVVPAAIASVAQSFTYGMAVGPDGTLFVGRRDTGSLLNNGMAAFAPVAGSTVFGAANALDVSCGSTAATACPLGTVTPTLVPGSDWSVSTSASPATYDYAVTVVPGSLPSDPYRLLVASSSGFVRPIEWLGWSSPTKAAIHCDVDSGVVDIRTPPDPADPNGRLSIARGPVLGQTAYFPIGDNVDQATTPHFDPYAHQYLAALDLPQVFAHPRANAAQCRLPGMPAPANQSVNEGDIVTVTFPTGSSFPAGHALTYALTQVSGPSPSYVQTTGTMTRRFVAPRPPTGVAAPMVFAATVTDTVWNLSTTKTFTVTTNNVVPVASPSAPKAATVNQLVTLKGGSIDAMEPDAVSGTTGRTYAWTQTAGPAVTLTPADHNATFTPTATGTYTFALVVTDHGGSGASSPPASVTTVVRAAPAATTLSGVVVDPAGAAVAGVSVSVRPGSKNATELSPAPVTDASGAWHIDNLTVGTSYFVRFTKAGFLTRWNNDLLEAANPPGLSVPNGVVDTVLTPTANGRRINVTVQAAGGAPLPTPVNLKLRVNDESNLPVDYTMSSGTFQVQNLTPKGTYRIQVVSTDAAFANVWLTVNGAGAVNGSTGSPALLLDTTAGDVTPPAVTLYTPAQLGTVTAAVKNAVGVGIESAEVRVYNTDGWVASATTDAGGNATIGSIRPGTDYRVWVWTKCPACLTAPASPAAYVSQWSAGITGEQYDNAGKLADLLGVSSGSTTNLAFTLST